MYEKMGCSSAGVSSPCGIGGGLFEKTIEAGREPNASAREDPVARAGDMSRGGKGVSGEGESNLGGVSLGVALLEDFLLSLPDSLLGPPKVDIKERTVAKQGGFAVSAKV